MWCWWLGSPFRYFCVTINIREYYPLTLSSLYICFCAKWRSALLFCTVLKLLNRNRQVRHLCKLYSMWFFFCNLSFNIWRIIHYRFNPLDFYGSLTSWKWLKLFLRRRDFMIIMLHHEVVILPKILNFQGINYRKICHGGIWKRNSAIQIFKLDIVRRCLLLIHVRFSWNWKSLVLKMFLLSLLCKSLFRPFSLLELSLLYNILLIIMRYLISAIWKWFSDYKII